MNFNETNIVEPVPDQAITEKHSSAVGLKKLHSNTPAQRIIGFLFGICFGFLLQRSGVADCDVIMGQLLLHDFTVVKVMLSAIIVGLILVNALFDTGWASPQPKPGGWGLIIPGGLVFGAGFAVLGYCPGTLAAAVGQGSMDALFAGLPGVICGAWLFAIAYPKLSRFLSVGKWRSKTVPQWLSINRWIAILATAFALTLILLLLEIFGL